MQGASAAGLAVLLLAAGCGSGERTPREPGAAPEDASHLSTFASAAAILPPAPLALAWADVDALREGPLSPLLERLRGGVPVPESGGTSFLRDNLESIHRLAGGIYVTLGGASLHVVLEGDFATETLFEEVKAWAAERGTKATSCKVRGRPGLRIGDTVLVSAGKGLFINGPEGLAGRTLDLVDRKVTGSALDAQTTYLAAHTIKEGAALVVSGVAPPSTSAWLESKNLPSVVGSRYLLAVSPTADVELRLGLLPGKPIKPIWFAQEVNTFLVRASKDAAVVELGMGDWVEGLDVELLGKGIVVRGSLTGEKIVEVVDSRSGG